jgi:hypothetical protein
MQPACENKPSMDGSPLNKHIETGNDMEEDSKSKEEPIEPVILWDGYDLQEAQGHCRTQNIGSV